VIAFFDASALVYLIEGAEPFASRLRLAVTGVTRQYRDAGTAISRLSWLECRVRPVREGEQAIVAAFDAFFARPDLIWVELTRDVVELATAIRVESGLRTPDALQAACCLQLGPAHLFITGDRMFKRVRGLSVRLLT
jgi:predicted nucleic acid-binding protein